MSKSFQYLSNFPDYIVFSIVTFITGNKKVKSKRNGSKVAIE